MAAEGAGADYCIPSGAGRSLRSLGLRAWRRAGAVAPAGPLRGPVALISHTPCAAGGLLGSAHFGAVRGRALRSFS